jgi:uncharacterized phage-associated protein
MRELVLYVSRAQRDDITFGRVKLAKLLYYSDNEAFVRLGESITGANYQKLPEGPAAREFVPLREEMLLDGDAEEVRFVWPSGLVSLRLQGRDPDESVFTAEQLEVIDSVVDRFTGVSGTAISKASHEEIGWQVAAENQTIPYEAYFLAPRLTSEQRELALRMIRDLSLAA